MSVSGLSSEDFHRVKSAIDEAAIVAITDKRGVITYVNEKFCSISKFRRDQLVGKTHHIVSSGVHDREFFVAMWEQISSGETWEGEICNRASDGTLYWVNTTIVPFIGEDGLPIRYVAVRYDITKRINAEKKLKLEAQKLIVSNRELQDFASVAAHDLQEPLRKIQAFADRLRCISKGSLSAEILDYLDRIQKSANRMQILINDLLSYPRLTSKVQPFSRVDLNEVMRHVISDLEVRVGLTGGIVTFGKLPTIEADPLQMHQLFLNLVNNALKFHRPEIAPVVRITSCLLNKSTDGSDQFEIRVEDNGIGFEEKYLDRIFTIFQRLHGRHEFEGTGIGLAICRKITERHSGTLTATSTPGIGSTFILKIPAHGERFAKNE